MWCRKTVSSVLLALIGSVVVMPKEATGADNQQPLPLIYFKDGLLGVNFFGFHAAAGLNGAGLHAEAGTPFGQRAGAGLGGVLREDGSVGGRLYAGATAGGNVRAAAGIGGTVEGGDAPRAVGGYFSAASAGPASAGKSVIGGVADDGKAFNVVERFGAPPSPAHAVQVAKAVEGDKTAQPLPPRVRKLHRVRGHKVVFDRFFPEGSTTDKVPKDVVVVSTTRGTPVDDDDDDDNEVATERKPSNLVVSTDAPRFIKSKRIITSAVPASADHGGSFLSAFFGPVRTNNDAASSESAPSPNTFFRDIFNIPISTLGAVGNFLSNNVPPVKASNLQVEKTITTS